MRAACVSGAWDRAEPWGVWGGHLLGAGAIVARKRPRGRPRKSDVVVPAAFRASELQSFTFTSDQDVAVNIEPKKGFVEPLILVQGGEPYSWAPGVSTPRAFEGDVSSLYITNESDSPAKVSIQMYTDVETPQVMRHTKQTVGTDPPQFGQDEGSRGHLRLVRS